MVTVDIESATAERIKAFECVIEAILDEPIGQADLVELILHRGLKSMLGDVIGNVETAILLESIFQMAEQSPDFVYNFVAARLKDGASSLTQEEARRQLGFKPRSAT